MAKKKHDDEGTPVALDPEIERVADALAIPKGALDDNDDAPLEVASDDEPAPEPAPAPIPTRKAKAKTTHKVTEFCGTLKHNGETFNAGDGVNLSDAEAKALGPNVERA